VGYTQYVYAATTHGAAWGTAQLALAPSPRFSTTLTYYRAIPAGSSPLLFDAIGEDSYLKAALDLRPVPALTLSHSQTYSFLTGGISERITAVSAALPRGQAVGVSWEDVARKVTISYSRAGLGSFSVFWYAP